MQRAGARRLVVIVAAAVLLAGCGTRVRTSNSASPLSGRAAPGGSEAATSPDGSPRDGDTGVPAASAATDSASANGPSGGSASANGGAGPSSATGPASAGTPADRTATDPATLRSGSRAGSAKPGEPATRPGPAPGDRQSAAGAPTVAPPPAAAGGARSPVPLGCVGTLSGPAATAIKPVVDGAQVWVSDVNARGGLNGHPVRLLVADDGGDPARHKQLVQEMVEVKKVIAFIAQPEVFTGQASVEYLTRARIPVIGGEGGGDWYYESPMYFPTTPSGDVNLQAFMHSVISRSVAAGKKKVGIVVCVEAQACRVASQSIELVARAERAELVYKGQASLAQPDFTPVCLSAANAGTETLLVVLDPNSIARVASACARQGYRPQYGSGAATTASFLKKDPNLDGIFIGSNIAPWILSNTPGRAEFQRAMARYLGATEPFGSHLQGWTSGKLLEHAVGTSLPEPPTAQAILGGLTTITDDDLDGLTYPLTFRPDQNAERVLCWWNLAINSGRFTSPDNGERRCAPYKTP